MSQELIQSSAKRLECVCSVYVDDVELCRGDIAWTHSLFEHITSQPGPAGWDLRGIETLLRYPFIPKPGQKALFVREGKILIAGAVPEMKSQQVYNCWPLAEDIT